MKANENNAAAHPKRRWYQFSLRTLLLFVLLCAIPLGWLGMKIRKGRVRETAVQMLRDMKCYVTWDFQIYNYDRNGGSPVPNGEPSAPRWLRNVLGDGYFGEVVNVGLNRNQLSDKLLEDIAGFTELKLLRLFGSEATDEQLKCLMTLTKLEELDLTGTEVTDAGLDCLQNLPQLRTLVLDTRQLTDAALVHLTKIKRLQYVYVRNLPDDDTKRLRNALPGVEFFSG